MAGRARALAMEGRAPTNVLASQDGYTGHIEPWLAVNPRDPRNLLPACDLPMTLGTYASFDGGLTWQSNGPLPTFLRPGRGSPLERI